MPVHLTSGTESGSWLPTPLSTLGSNGGPNARDSSGRPGLQMAARNWPTPDARDSNPEGLEAGKRRMAKYSTCGLQTAVKLWQTPVADDAGHLTSGTESGLSAPTPTARDWRSGKGKTQKERGRSHGMSLSEWSGGSLNPTWVEWLMGWPLGWTDCAVSATGKFQQWQRSHGISCLKLTPRSVTNARH